MEFKRTLIILVIFILAGGGYYLDQHRIQTNTQKETETSRVVHPEKTKVTGITLTHANTTLKFEKASGAWRMETPVATAADQSTVDGLLTQLDNATTKGGFDIKSDELAKYGLDKPSSTVEVAASADNYTQKIELGSPTPAGGEVYARKGDANYVFVIPQALNEQITQKPKFYRDKRLAQMDVSAATSFTLVSSGHEFVLAKRDNKWMIDSPQKGLADQNKVSEMLNEISSARADDFIDTATRNLAPYGLETVNWSATLYAPAEKIGDKATSATLMIGDVVSTSTSNKRYARRAGSSVLLEVKPDLPVKLAATYGDLRDKSLFDITAANVGEMQITAQGKKTALARDAQGSWHFKSSAAKVDQQQANIKLTGIAGLKALRFLDTPTSGVQTGLESPILRLTLSSVDGKTTETLLTGKKALDGDFVYARRDGRPELLALDWQEPGNYILGPADFEDKTLLVTPQEKVSKIEIDDGGKKLTVVPQKDRQSWTATGAAKDAKGVKIDKEDAETLLATLTGLEWERRLDPQSPTDAAIINTKQLDKIRREITITDDQDKAVLHLMQPEVMATPTPTPSAVRSNTPIDKFMYLKTGANQYFEVDRARFAPIKTALDKLILDASK